MGKEVSPGARIDRYTVVRHVATGGMGSIWECTRADTDGASTKVALKTVRSELAGDPAFKAMFQEEARISSRLAHPNVAQVLGIGEDEGTVYIVFEWVEGRSLDAICEDSRARGEPVPLELALRVLADVCAGLHAVHEMKDEDGVLLDVVHRDVSPANVLVGPEGFAKIIDLGLAKARDRAGLATRSGVVKGTPQFMAPEQAMGQPVDRRADVFSAGALLYRVLAGRPPFPDSDSLGAFVMGKMPPELPERVPAKVRALVWKAMCSDPDERFATAEDMRAALKDASSVDLDAPRPSLPSAMSPARARKRNEEEPAAASPLLLVGIAFAAGLVALALVLALRS